MKAAIYARISKDREGAGLGVERQIEECTELASSIHATIVATYSDNDLSAYKGKHRPGYEALLDAMKTGQIEAVIAWHSDRLTRSMVELESYVQASEVHSVATYTVRAGLIDLSTPSGRLVARQLGAVARYEVEHAIERQKAAKLQAARAGQWGGGLRPFGYEKDGVTLRESEAAIVREIVKRFIAGESWRTIAIDLNTRGILTSGGKRWNAAKTRNVAYRLRNIGIREHHGMQYPAVWPAIFDRETRDRLLTAIEVSRAQYKRRGKYRRYLLQGFTYCGNCGNRMNSFLKQNRDGSLAASFRCRPHDIERGKIGCGKVSRRMEPLEHLVIESVMYRLDTDGLAELAAQTSTASPKLRAMLDQQRAQAARLTEIVDLYAGNRLTFDEYQAMKVSAQVELDSLSRRIEAATAGVTLRNVPLGQTLRQAWSDADDMWRRQLLDTVIDKIWIDGKPSIKGYAPPRYEGWFFDPSLVRIDWRA